MNENQKFPGSHPGPGKLKKRILSFSFLWWMGKHRGKREEMTLNHCPGGCTIKLCRLMFSGKGEIYRFLNQGKFVISIIRIRQSFPYFTRKLFEANLLL